MNRLSVTAILLFVLSCTSTLIHDLHDGHVHSTVAAHYHDTHFEVNLSSSEISHLETVTDFHEHASVAKSNLANSITRAKAISVKWGFEKSLYVADRFIEKWSPLYRRPPPSSYRKIPSNRYLISCPD